MTNEEETPVARVVELWRFPVKSLRGHTLERATLTRTGLAWDRFWMVVDASGKMVTQRTVPRMATVSARVDEESGTLTLRDETRPDRACTTSVFGEPESSRPERPARVWSDTVQAREADPAASAWLRDVLGVECSLVYFPPSAVRAVDPAYAGPEDRTHFADGFPMLLASVGSLRSLNTTLERPVVMERFRANVVIDGSPAWDEERWTRVRIGAVSMRTPKPCTRCSIVDVEPATGASAKGTLEALRALRSEKGAAPAAKGKTCFGQNMLHDALGELRVGDAVYVLERLANEG